MNFTCIRSRARRACGSLSRGGIGLAIVAFAFVLAKGPAAPAAGLLMADGGLGGVLEVEEHAVHVTINNGIAVTQVRQVFLNTEERQVEALYTFPVPKGASVANFSMWIGGTEMVGEVVEKERARQIYDSYRRVRRDPGLLEQVDYRTFEMRIFPIAPRAESRVEVTYYQDLDFDDDWATYVYPLATTTRRDLSQRTTGKFSMALEIKSEVPVVEVESPSHASDFAVAKHTDFYAQASLETKAGDLGKDVVLAYRTSRPRTGIDVITSKEKSDDGYFALSLTAGEELAGARGGMDYVFVLDVSGSMDFDNKLDISRNSLGAFVKALGADDRFDVVCFNVGVQALFSRLSPGDEPSKAAALEHIARREARGATVLRPAVETAYKYADPARSLNVVILSDGLTEQEERSRIVQLIKTRPASSRVFCIGIGNDVNRGLLEQLADESGGIASFISRGDDFTRQAQAFRRKLLRPVAENLKIEFGGLEFHDVEPRRLPNLYHGTPVRVYGRYKGSGNATIAITTHVAGKVTTRTVEVPFPAEDLGNPQIERMWASKRVDRLLKEADAEGQRSGVVDEIVRLGERYSIASEYTSFIVLENDAEYRRWKIDRRNALRLARDRQAQEQLAAQLDAIRQKAHTDLGPEAARPAAEATPTTGAPAGASPSPAAQAPPSATPQSSPPASSPHGHDLDLGIGGGALDPISGSIAVGLGILGWAASRRRKARD